MSVHVIGHKNPDTDAICSAIACAWMLNQLGVEATAYRAGAITKETQFALDQAGVQAPELLEQFLSSDQYALVDTNNPEELIPGYAEATLTSIIDHHKFVGGLSTSSPISVTIEPVAATATLIYLRLQQHNLTPPKEIATLMQAAIISDTLKFTSPTTTPTDTQSAEQLAVISGASTDDLAAGMFAAKSDISDQTPEQILNTDSKVFPMGEKKVRVAVHETTNPAGVLALRETLEKAMQAQKEAEQLDAFFFFVVDILTNGSELIVASESEKAQASAAFAIPFTEATLSLPGIVSRKKQMIPNLEATIK